MSISATNFFTRARRVLTTPGRSRSVALRRLAAAGFVLLAGVSALHSARQHPEVVVFARDVPAGRLLQPGDLKTARLPAAVIPGQAVTVSVESLTSGDRVITAAASAGEVLTQARLLSPNAVSTSGDLHLVPVPLAEPEIARLLHHGDVVAIVSADKQQAQPRTIATGARIITTSLPGQNQGRAHGTLLVALPADAAREVAAAALSLPLTIVITGARATGHN